MKIHSGDNTPFKNEIKNLWAFAFSDPESFVNYYFDEVWQGENAVSIADAETLAAALELVPYTLSVRGRFLPASYIVGVSVAGDFRGRGLSTILMKAGLKKQLERDEIISFLVPFSYPFYEKQGYEKAYSELHLSARREDLKVAKSNGRFRPAQIEDYDILSRIYRDFCKDKNGYTLRTKADWSFIFKELVYDGGFLQLYLDESDAPTAYIACLKDEKHFKVLEMAYTNDEGLSALLSFVQSHASYDSYDFILPAKSPVPGLLGKKAKAELFPGAMARLIQIEKGLVCGLGNVKMLVDDAFLPENSGIYEEIDGKITKTDGTAWDIRIDVASLTQLVFGYHSAEELQHLGRLKGREDAITQLSRLYPKEENYLNLILRDDF